MTTTDRRTFGALLDSWLSPGAFKDVAENGLQVEGKDAIAKVVTGVSANLAFLERAIEAGADAVVVHHGIVWGGGIRKLDGWLGARVRFMHAHALNLFAYHLPLDAQPEFGNNVGVARALGVVDATPFGAYKGQLIGLQGRLAVPLGTRGFADLVGNAIGPPRVVLGMRDDIRTVGICTGGAPELLHDAIAAGLDAYVTGEVTEWCQAVAEESGTVFVAAGHHATERFGPRGLAERLRAHGIDASFIDVENPA